MAKYFLELLRVRLDSPLVEFLSKTFCRPDTITNSVKALNGDNNNAVNFVLVYFLIIVTLVIFVFDCNYVNICDISI